MFNTLGERHVYAFLQATCHAIDPSRSILAASTPYVIGGSSRDCRARDHRVALRRSGGGNAAPRPYSSKRRRLVTATIRRLRWRRNVAMTPVRLAG